MEIGVFEARNRFSELVDAAEHGEEVVILRRGRPVVRLTAVSSRTDLAAARRDALDRMAELRHRTLQELGRPFTHEELTAARDEGKR